MLHLNGHAEPDSRVALYVDNNLIGTVNADATGSWTYSGNRQLEGGRHAMRADLLAQGSNVVARAEVDFARDLPVATAQLDRNDKTSDFYRNSSAASADQIPRTISDAANETVTTPTQLASDKSNVVIVKRGDTLWQIAQRHYGDGAKYTQIFRTNRTQIRNPNWIYPNQRFELPE